MTAPYYSDDHVTLYHAFLADQNCPYDVAVEIGARLVRIQVKATRKARAVPQRTNPSSAYMWHVRRAGKNGSRVYRDGEFDALALVALDVQRIAYLPPEDQKQTVHIRVPGYVPPNPARLGKVGKEFDDFPFSRALRSLGVPDERLDGIDLLPAFINDDGRCLAPACREAKK